MSNILVVIVILLCKFVYITQLKTIIMKKIKNSKLAFEKFTVLAFNELNSIKGQGRATDVTQTIDPKSTYQCMVTLTYSYINGPK
jgi:hypothetical protein